MSDNSPRDIARWDNTSFIMEIVRESFARFNMEIEIVQCNAIDYELGEDEKIIIEHEKSIHEQEALKQAAIVVVFAAIAIESHINEYAERKMGGRYFKRYIEQLSVEAKLILVPKLVCGKEFPRDCNTFQMVRRIIKERNDIVHSKAKNVDADNVISDVQKRRDSAQDFLRSIPKVIDSLAELSIILKSLDPDDMILGWSLGSLHD